MKTIGAILFGFVLLEICFSQTCPPCPETGTCDSTVRLRGISNKKCICSICVNFCWDRFPRCKVGEACVRRPVDCPAGYGCGSTTSAVCEPFTGCIPPADTCSCPVSGFLKDQNNCDSCLCNDPCKEMNCPEANCEKSSVTSNLEPTYTCMGI